MFDHDTVENALNEAGWELPLVLLDEIDSTNTEAKRRIREKQLPDGGLILTDRQTAGKGRLERTWYAVEGKDLTFTLAFKNELNRVDIPKTGLAAALGVCEALEKEFSLDPWLKWPNDIIVEGKKVGGILSEYITPQEFIIIGVGLNVNSDDTDWKFDTYTPPTSLKSMLGADVERESLLASCAVAIRDYLQFARWEYFPTFQTLYERRAFYSGKRVTIYQDVYTEDGSGEPDDENAVEGIAMGIDRYGALTVRDDDGKDHSVRAGDMVVVKE